MNYDLQKIIKLLSRIFAFAVIAIAIYSLSGIAFFTDYFVKTNLYGVVINPLAIILFILAGISIFIMVLNEPSRQQIIAGKIIACCIILISLGVNLKYFFGVDLSLDRILFTDKVDRGIFIRISFPSALSFFLEGVALLIIRDNRSISKLFVQVNAIIVGFIGTFLLLSYIFKAIPFLNLFTSSPTALYATICHLLISFILYFTHYKDIINEALLKEMEDRYKNIVETAQEGILVIDIKGNIDYVNEYAANKLKVRREDLIGASCFRFFKPEDLVKLKNNLENRKNGNKETYEIEVVCYDKSIIVVIISASPIYKNGAFVGSLAMITDITQNKCIEKELERTAKLYNVLSRITRLLVNVESEKTLFEESCKILVDYSSDLKLAWIGEHLTDTKKVINIASAGEAILYAKDLNITTDDSPESEGPTGIAIKTGKAYICNNYYEDSSTLLWREKAKNFGFCSSAIFPLKLHGNLWGALNVYASTVHYFQEAEIGLFEKIAEVITVGMEKLEDETIRKKKELELIIAKEEWERTFDSIPDSIAILDTEYNIVRVNKAMADLLNIPKESVMAKKCYALMHGIDCPIDDCPQTNLLKDGKSHKSDVFEKTLDKYIEHSASPIFNTEGKIIGSVHIGRNITAVKKSKHKIKQLADINEYSTAFVSMANIDHSLIYFNNAARKVLEIETEEDITKYKFDDFNTQKTIEILIKIAAPILKEKGIWVGELEWKSKSGKIIPVFQVIMFHKNQTDEVEYISTTAIDISELKEKEEKLNKQTYELRALNNRLLTIREDERKAMAKEIHDELGQNLTALKMEVSWVATHIDGDREKLKDMLEQIKKITEDTVQTSRRLYNSLYPQMMDDVGLLGTIKWHASNFLKPASIDFEIITNFEEEILPELHSIWLVLYRTYQECITNVLRYAKANLVVVELNIIDNNIYMRIEDDGIGFDIDNIDTKLHHGVLGMRERIKELNGQFTIDSTIGKGSTIIAIIPIPKLE